MTTSTYKTLVPPHILQQFLNDHLNLIETDPSLKKNTILPPLDVDGILGPRTIEYSRMFVNHFPTYSEAVCNPDHFDPFINKNDIKRIKSLVSTQYIRDATSTKNLTKPQEMLLTALQQIFFASGILPSNTPNYPAFTSFSFPNKRRTLNLGSSIDGFEGPDTLQAFEQWQQNLRTTTTLLINPNSPVPIEEILVTARPPRVSPATTAAIITATQPQTKRPIPGTPKIKQFSQEFYRTFGQPGDETNLRSYTLPFPLRLAWDLSTSVKTVRLHHLAGPSAMQALEDIFTLYNNDLSKLKQLNFDLFGGGYNYRKMRGGTSYSMHAFGLALDFDPLNNQLKSTRNNALFASTPERIEFLKIFELNGWTSLGLQRNYDWMHVQLPHL